VVPSFDDALMAARLNFRLQACVVRRRFAHRSRHDTSSLRQFVSLLGSDDLMDRPPDERAQVLARSLARISQVLRQEQRARLRGLFWMTRRTKTGTTPGMAKRRPQRPRC